MEEKPTIFDCDDELLKELNLQYFCEFKINDISYFRETIKNDITKRNIDAGQRLKELKKELEGVSISETNVELYAEECMEEQSLERGLASLKTLEELSILSLHRHLEITLTNLLTTKYYFELVIASKNEENKNKRKQAEADLSRKKRSLHRFERIKTLLEEHSIDISSLEYFQTYNELRCLANAIKHSGVVTNDLSFFSDWNIDEELSYDELNIAYDRLSTDIGKFIRDLCTRVNG